MGPVVRAVLLGFVLIYSVKAQSDDEIALTLDQIFFPTERPTIQAQALRRDIVRMLYDALEQEALEEDLLAYKRSLNSLARWGNLPAGKRNLASLAKNGYIKTLPDEDGNDKRSIANLAKNGQLPSHNDDDKRGIESLARNGELHPTRDVEELLEELYGKRNIGSLAKNFNYPSYGKRYIGALAKAGGLSRYVDNKRNVASLARDGDRFYGKRNVAALLRQDKIHGPNDRSYGGIKEEQDTVEDKRNLASVKAGYKTFKRSVPAGDGEGRTKRQAEYYEASEEYASPVYQNQNIYDYEELMKALTGEYPNTDKRFLGSVARSGWFRPANSNARFTSGIDKRHIGSLARLGWLPAFRSVRRFNRSGRSITDCEREAAENGNPENYAPTKNQVPVDDRRYSVHPYNRKLLLAGRAI